MLSLGKLAPGQQQYYLDNVARGADEYYTGAREAPGVWLGGGADRLGLSGRVDAAALGHVLEHLDPTGSYRLTASRSVPTVAGFDVTFCAPKSVSLLFALGDPEVSNEVRNAADAAVGASLAVLEDAACRVRRGHGGLTVLDGDGFVAAGFRHRTSRAGDPHLHTHVVIANLAHAPSDGRWTALDARPLYHWLAPVGYLYEAQLRWELTHRLGVQWGPVRNGIADIAGIPREAIRAFSTRRREIEAHLAAHGQTSARAAQLATYATRRTKNPSLEPGELLAEWRLRAEAHGLDPATLADVVDRHVTRDPPTVGSREAEHLYRWLASPEGLTAQRSTFGERDVIKAICNALPAGGRVDHVLALTHAFLASDHVVALNRERERTPIRRRDGIVAPALTGGAWSTPELLALETRLVSTAAARTGAGIAVVDPSVVERVIADRLTLSAEQTRMVRTLCSSGDGVDVIDGAAGAGKTYALNAARHAWEASGHRVLGCALAARAAQELQDGSGIRSSTFDRLLHSLDHGIHLGADWVVVVDEAAMVGTRKLARLIDHAAAGGAKLVLVGDPCQLPEIDAGGAFRGLRDRLDDPGLVDNRRQVDRWERHALAELRTGDPNNALAAYREHGRVHLSDSDRDAKHALVDAWYAASARGDDALMIAGRLRDVDDLNSIARDVLRAHGCFGGAEVQIGGRWFAVGDVVLALRNDYDVGLLNGTRATVEHIDTGTRRLCLQSGPRRVDVPFDYVEAGLLTHGYATTIHKAQGATVDRGFVLLDETASREQIYTALSRGRLSNDMFSIADDRRIEDRHTIEITPEPIEQLQPAFTRSAAKSLAIDQIEPSSGSTLDHLRLERQQLADRIGAGPPDPSREYRDVSVRLEGQQRNLADAHYRLDYAHQQLRRLGPLRRITHRTDRHDLEDRIERFTTDVATHEQTVIALSRRLREITPDMEARSAWEHEHRYDLSRADSLDRRIDMTEWLGRYSERDRTLALEREPRHRDGPARDDDLGLEL